MSNFAGVTFAEQNVTPSSDGTLYNAIFTDGILTGCQFSYVGSTLTMASGKLMVSGRLIRHVAASSWAIADAISGYARVVLTIDLTRTSVAGDFQQVTTEIEYATALDGFNRLFGSDINERGNKYQAVLCVVELSQSGISRIVKEMPFVSIRANQALFATATGIGDTLALPQNQKIAIPFGEWRSNTTDAFLFRDNAVVMPRDGSVEVSASVYFNSASSSAAVNAGPYIYKNGAEIAGRLDYLEAATAVQIAPIIVSVSAGDTLSLLARIANRAGTCIPNARMTFLSVRYITGGGAVAEAECDDCVKTVNGIAPDENGNVDIRRLPVFPDGSGGEAGFSPIATVTPTADGAVISITDKTGTTTATVTNGVDGITPHIGSNGNWFLGEEDTGNPSRGEKGAQGFPGNPGTSVRHTWDGSVLTITSGVSAPVEQYSSSVDLKGPKGDSVGIKSINESTESGGSNRITFTDGNMLAVKNGVDGQPGADGITPHIGSNGNWFLGEEDTGNPSRGEKGAQGLPGNPGTSVRHTWDGSVLTITSGVSAPVGQYSSSVDLKGPKGDSVGIKSINESTESGGSSRIAFTDGKMLAIKNGVDGQPGADGITPHIGSNGNWFLGEEDTGNPSRGEKGDRGIAGMAGKTAYQYALTGGFLGTEAEYSAKMATPFVTPQMYGAKGDGVTDDTLAFQNALAENDNVFVPEGNYLLTDGLNITYKKGLFSNDGQRATIHFNGSGSIINLGRLSVFRNINIRIKNAFVGTVFKTHNHNINSGQGALESRVGNVNVFFEVASPEAVLIGITVDSGTDPNNMPRLKGICYQTFHDICVEYGSNTYGCGIKMELIQGRAFTEETKIGFPWITHIDYDDIFLGSPHTAIKAGVTNTSGTEKFERVNMGHILFNNVSTQYRDSESTQIFLDLNNFGGFFTKCIGWDYHPLTWENKKVNIIGENVVACFTNSKMAFGADFLRCCDFTAEPDYNVDENPEYFISKYFPGTVLSDGYDSVDAKIDAKLSGEFIANIAEEKINDVLYSGYYNVLDDPLTQIRVGRRWSSSSAAWVDSSKKTSTIIVPLVIGGNIIRWSPARLLSDEHKFLYYFKDDELTEVLISESWDALGVSRDGGYLEISNPSGYKYLAIPFWGGYSEAELSADSMTMTINREITGNDGQSFAEYLNESVITPAVNARVDEAVENLSIPTKVSQLENDEGYLTEVPEGYAKIEDIPSVPTKTSELTNNSGFITASELAGYALKSSAETWTFTLADGSTVSKKVVIA